MARCGGNIDRNRDSICHQFNHRKRGRCWICIVRMVCPRRRPRCRRVWHLACDQGVCSARRQTILSIPAGQARPGRSLEPTPQRYQHGRDDRHGITNSAQDRPAFDREGLSQLFGEVPGRQQRHAGKIGGQTGECESRPQWNLRQPHLCIGERGRLK